MTAGAVSLQACMARLTNTTEYPTKFFETFIDFVQAMLPTSCSARFEISDKVEGDGDRVTGEASVPSFLKNTGFPCLVRIWVTEQGSVEYPRLDQYVPALPPILLRCWEEEVFLTIAHELRHVHQFMSPAFKTGAGRVDYDLEVDAESFAYEALTAWRQRSHRRRCTTFKKAA